jgi:hypothetical protein
MNHLKMCLNWKVMAALAAVGVGIFIFAPGLAVAALPFLVLAICPLSMVFMMGAMNNMGKGSQSGAACAMGGNRKSQSREEELAQLEAQQRELASKIAQLEAEPEVRPEARPGAAATQPG